MAFSLFSSKNRIVNLIVNDHSVRFVELKQAKPLLHKNGANASFPQGSLLKGRLRILIRWQIYWKSVLMSGKLKAVRFGFLFLIH